MDTELVKVVKITLLLHAHEHTQTVKNIVEMMMITFTALPPDTERRTDRPLWRNRGDECKCR